MIVSGFLYAMFFTRPCTVRHHLPGGAVCRGLYFAFPILLDRVSSRSYYSQTFLRISRCDSPLPEFFDVFQPVCINAVRLDDKLIFNFLKM